MTALQRTSRQRGLPALAAVVAAFLLLPVTVVGAELPTDKVVATVNGQAITEGDLIIAAQEFDKDLAQVPPDQQRAQLISIVVDIKLLALAAEAQGLDKSENVVRNLAFIKQRLLRNEYLKTKVMAAVTDDLVRQRFGEELATFVPADQVHVRHVLVKTEDEAKAVIADLDKGGDFAAIAKEKSQDPGSAPNGGDLGFIGRGQTVPPFEDAAFALAIGAYSKTPVQTNFGWHVIKLEEKRKEAPPTFDERRDQIRNDLLQQAFTKELAALHKAADIKIVEPPPAAAATPPADGTTPPAAPDAPAPAQ